MHLGCERLATSPVFVAAPRTALYHSYGWWAKIASALGKLHLDRSTITSASSTRIRRYCVRLAAAAYLPRAATSGALVIGEPGRMAMTAGRGV